MPVTFARLRIAGFKSFAEPAAVEILPGLTGIVGPNGCGKSNVVEALRWAMGESSARSLRGGEMDDLIFAGTAARPARNLAEVVLTLQQAAGLAPPPFHEQDELQISRRIERGAGSAYRVNGAELRARDVQTLFADLASGARSSAMVSQGRVAAIVGARPDERRGLLEEAAGITGLHARRHEAELKLRATEANLVRAEDLRQQLEQRVQALAGQARQAARYRALAGQLGDAGTALLALLHARARHAVEAAVAARRDGGVALMAAERRLSQAASAERAADAALTAPREALPAARALLERRRILQETGSLEGERAEQAAAQAETLLQQANQDRDEAAARLDDAERETARLEAESASLEHGAQALPGRRIERQQQVAALRGELMLAEQAAQVAQQDASLARTRSAEAARDRQAAEARLQRASAALAQIEAERDRQQAELPEQVLLDALEAGCGSAAAALMAAETALETALESRTTAERDGESARLRAAEQHRRHHEARETLQQAERLSATLDQEHATLQRRHQAAEQALVQPSQLERAAALVGQAEQALAQAAVALEAAEAARSEAVSARLEASSRRQDSARQHGQMLAAQEQAAATRARASQEHASLAQEHALALQAMVAPDRVAAATMARTEAERALAVAERGLVAADQAQQDASRIAEQAATARAERQQAHARLQAEIDGLAQALDAAAAPGGGAGWARLADTLQVPQGLELALAACLADGLEASFDPAAPLAWLALPGLEHLDPLPAGCTSLDGLIEAPPPLQRVLSQTGLLPDGWDGAAMQAGLRPGQCLVRRDGALWRWDGYRVADDAPSPAARRLQQRMRLREAEALLAVSAAALLPAEAAHDQAAGRRESAASAAQAARLDRAGREQALSLARDAELQLRRRDDQTRARLEALTPAHERVASVLAEAEAALASVRASLERLEAPSMLAAAQSVAERHEADAIAAEGEARASRRHAEAALGQARDALVALGARDSESRSAQAMLVPLLARTQDQLSAAAASTQTARDALADLSPQAADAALSAAGARSEAAALAEQAAREGRRRAQVDLAEAAAARDRLASARLEGRSRLEALQARLQSAVSERDDASAASEALQSESAEVPDPAVADAAAMSASEALAALRAAERAASEQLAGLAAEQAALEARRGSLASARGDWRARGTAAATSLQAASSRLEQAGAEHALRRDAPAEAARRLATLQADLEAAEAMHQVAQETLQHAEAAWQAAQREHRAVEAGLASAREAAVRAESRAEQAQAILAQLLAEGDPPAEPEPDDVSEGAEASLRRRVARLTRERDEIGPVNLRAELELEEAEAQSAAILREREELEGAIARLRGQIGHLNREGRERLMAVFDVVDRHFQALFARMFDGGRAHLGLVGSDDPLSAGLEIYAQPPGKKLATLSLLSGGEQALTALSLIFAVFRCNPAPICVLDEVDAPLDDANVERFCRLLADMAGEAGTRFLVVTHHQLTMAHMDRLYGVTMQERGVSRVLSVDLAHAAAMVG